MTIVRFGSTTAGRSRPVAAGHERPEPTRYPVGKAVGNVWNEGAQLIERINDPIL